MICDIQDPKTHTLVPYAPRLILKNQLKCASDMGVYASGASELEYFMLVAILACSLWFFQKLFISNSPVFFFERKKILVWVSTFSFEKICFFFRNMSQSKQQFVDGLKLNYGTVGIQWFNSF